MKYMFIEEHKHEFAVAVMCGVLVVSRSQKAAFIPGANVRPAGASKKMLI